MKALYINNFRGFKKTFIPINRVNFLVGENSSGKTSILKLLKLLSDFPFRYNLEFYSPEVDLGRFEDIVSKFDAKIKFFEIGLFSEKGDPTHSLFANNMTMDHYKLCKIKFIEKDEKTTVSEISFKSEFIEICVKLIDNIYKLNYKINKSGKVSEEKNIEEAKKWMTNESSLSKSNNFKEVSEDASKPDELRWILRIISDEIIKEIKEKNLRYEISRKIMDLMSIQDGFLPDLKWIAPIRAEPKRIYENLEAKSSPDGSHAPQILKEILLNNSKSSQKFKDFLEKYGKSSHLFDEIKIRKFGSEKFAPFEIQVFLEGKPYSISNVGYGVSQVLPLLLEIFDEKSNFLAIQQPEVHLHPIAQAEFGEIIYNSINESIKSFFIETHSDFTIDRFRYCVHKNGFKNDKNPKSAQILYFHREKDGNKLYSIPLNDDGSYMENEISNFRDFFINESIKLLGM